MGRTFKDRVRTIAAKYRSGFEERVAKDLEKRSIDYRYECLKIKYVKPARQSTYTPDFILPNGIIIEAKGYFEAQDRVKHLTIRDQYPDLDIRFVFQNHGTRLSPKSKTTYGDWCEKHGFLYAQKTIPHDWLSEIGDPENARACFDPSSPDLVVTLEEHRLYHCP